MNFPDDDNTPATYRWSVSTPRATFVPDMKVNGAYSKNNRCAVLELGKSYQPGMRDYVTFNVTLGNAMVSIGLRHEQLKASYSHTLAPHTSDCDPCGNAMVSMHLLITALSKPNDTLVA